MLLVCYDCCVLCSEDCSKWQVSLVMFSLGRKKYKRFYGPSERKHWWCGYQMSKSFGMSLKTNQLNSNDLACNRHVLYTNNISQLHQSYFLAWKSWTSFFILLSFSWSSICTLLAKSLLIYFICFIFFSLLIIVQLLLFSSLYELNACNDLS